MSTLLVSSARALTARRWQTVGLGILVAVLVTTVAGATRAGRTLEHTRQESYERLRLADLEIRCSPTQAGAVDPVRSWPEIEAAEERMLMAGVFRGDGVPALPAVIQILSPQPPTINRLEFLAGRYPRSDEASVVLDRSLGREFGLEVGDVVEVEIGSRRQRLPVGGLVLSPDQILSPCHPVYRLPLAGTIAVVALSPAAARQFEHTDLVDVLRFRFTPGTDAEALEARLLEALPVSPLAIVPRDKADAERMASQFLSVFDIYLPAALLILMGVTLTLLVLTLHRTVARQRVQIGLLLSLGHRPWAIAASYLPIAVVPTLAGALLGALGHGWYAHYVTTSYSSSIGFAPLHDAGPGPELLAVSLACLGLAAVATLVPALLTAGGRPFRLLRRVPTRALEGSAVARGLARLRDRLRVPLSVALGLGYQRRRPWTTLFTVLALGLTLALVMAFTYVHLTHEAEAEDVLANLGLDASVQFSAPVGDDVLAEAARLVNGRVEAQVVGLALMTFASGPTLYPLVCLEPDGWFGGMQVPRGRPFASPDAHEIIVDQWIVDTYGLHVGDDVTCFPGRNAPEGLTVRVVGVLDGSSLGLVIAPLEFGRALFELPGLATGMDVASDLSGTDMERVLRALPDVDTVMALGVAREKMGDNFAGLSRILLVLVGTGILLAVLFLGILAALDSADRASDMAVLGALGWRDRSTLAICITEVLGRGALALLVAIPAAPWLARWLLGRIREVNHYRLDLLAPSWVPVAVGLACLLLVPLSALPAWRHARSASPGRAVRVLAHE